LIDLHTHSSASDGDLSPADLVLEARKKGISTLALTDHDTLAGLESAALAAKAAGIGFVPGIEISINWRGEDEVCHMGRGGEMHVLGLGIRSPTPGFLAAVADLSVRRETRNREIMARVLDMGVDATWEEVVALSGGHSVGRPHFAMLLVNKKVVRTHEQAFDRFLRPGKPLYAPKTGLTFADAADMIRESGGIPVLAHPMSLFVAWGRMGEIVGSLRDRGLMGLEAWHPTAKPKACRRLERMAAELGLLVTEGSDFHGSAMSYRRLGWSNKDRQISDSLLDSLPNLLLKQ